MPPNIILELRRIAKSFPGVVALQDVTLRVHAGEVLGLIGENGAGKSTLMNILGGVCAPSAGWIMIAGREYARLSVPESIRHGIAFIHQELNILDNLDVGANVFLGREPVRGGPLRIIDRRLIYRRTRPYLDCLGLTIAPHTLVRDLSVAQQQMVEIAKALSLNARIIIMDEPTSSLTLSETEKLMAVIRDLRAKGVTVIYISHRLAEVRQCADRVVVLRDGQNAGELRGPEITHDAMIRMMVGRDVGNFYIPTAGGKQPGYFQVKNLRSAAYPEKSVTFDVAAGEILGFAGLVGAGRSEIMQAVFGVDRRLGGALALDGKDIVINCPRDAINRGIFLIPEDRKRSGLVLAMTVRENITLPDLRSHARLAVINRRSERAAAEKQCAALKVKTPSIEAKTLHLSGGNQQKVVLAKWLALNPKVLIFDEPTRGIDVGAKAEIYGLIRDLADRGVAVIIISSEMEEIIGVSSRLAVMHEGAIAGVLARDRFTEENIMRLAVGGGAAAAGKAA